MADSDELLSEFDARQAGLAVLGTRVEALIADLLRGAGIRTHSIEHRIKNRSSLARKLRGSEGRYTALNEVTDCLGFRVITYFADEVDSAAGVLADNFTVDWANSPDRRSPDEPEKFGYASLHYVVRLSRDRARLPEYRPFADQPFEIQLRSILQHAWAEIEHDLGYQSTDEVPAEARRRFSRLSGLLELADDEFRAIRDDLQAHVENAQMGVRSAPEHIVVDRDALLALVDESEVVAGVDRSIARGVGAEIGDFPRETVGRSMVRRGTELRQLGLQTVKEVEEALSTLRDVVRALAVSAIQGTRPEADEGRDLPRGISLLYLVYVLVLTRNRSQIGLRRELIRLGRDDHQATETASMLISAWSRVRGSFARRLPRGPSQRSETPT